MGTVTTGVWNATTINPNKGGTGIDNYAKGDILYAGSAIANTATTALSKLALGTAGYTLQATADGPAWTQTVAVANGGTGNTSWTQWGILYASANTTLTNTAAGTNGALLSGKGSAAPVWKASANGAVYATAENGDLQWGTLPIGQGGTGNTSFTATRLVYSETAEKLASTTITSDGAYLGNISYLSVNTEHQTDYRAYIQGTTCQHGPLHINVGDAGVDITQSNNASATNGITSNTSRIIYWVDSNGKSIARVYGRADTNGNCNLILQAGNWYGDTPAQKHTGLSISLPKNGASTCTISTTNVKIGDLTFGGSTTDEKRTIASAAAMYLKKASGETLYIQDGDTNVIVVNSSNHLYPVTTNTLNLGTSNFKWASVYATTFYGDLSGNASTATKATKDGSGNTITSFYLPINGSKAMTGELILVKDKYGGPGNDIGLDCRNSDIVNANGYFTADVAGDFSEAINFKRSSTKWDSFGVDAGKFWFGANLAYGASFQTNGSIVLAGAYAGSDNTIKMYLDNTNEMNFYTTSDRIWLNYRQTTGTRITTIHFGNGLNNGSYAVIHAASLTSHSSRLIKENINTISEYEAKKLLFLRPVTFDYIKSYSNLTNQVGLIAEEVEPFFPHLVDNPKKTDEKPVYKGLTYTTFIPYLIKLAQTQQREIDSLKNELNILKNELNI